VRLQQAQRCFTFVIFWHLWLLLLLLLLRIPGGVLLLTFVLGRLGGEHTLLPVAGLHVLCTATVCNCYLPVILLP
jgi:hypothetical protein